MIYKLIYIALAIASVGNCNKLPGVTRCISKQSQGAFDKCILKQARDFLPTFAKGLPALSVPPIDPLQVDHASLSSGNLDFDIYNATLTGLRNASIQQFQLDLKTGKSHVTLIADLKVHGRYVLHGHLIKTFPVNGNGDIDIYLNSMQFVLDVDFITVKKNGKEHSKLTTYTSEYTVLDKAIFAMTNLFEGKNDLLAKTAVAVINDDWEEMIQIVAKPAIHEILKNIISIIGLFFDAVPMVELYPDMAKSV